MFKHALRVAKLEYVLTLGAKEASRMPRTAGCAFWIDTGDFGTHRNEFLNKFIFYAISILSNKYVAVLTTTFL